MLRLTKRHAQLNLLRTKLEQFVSFSEAAWSAAQNLFRERNFAAEAYIIEAGEVVKDVHFLLIGIARFYYLTPEGKEFNKSFAQSGQTLSSINSLVTGMPSPFFIQALEPCECMSIKYTDLTTVCNSHTEWERLTRRLLEQLAIKKERREADFLLLSAAERYKKFLDEFSDIADSIPNYHVASYLGITDVALSRIRGRLGLIKINKD